YNDMITKKRLNQRTVREGEEITGYRDVELYLLHPPPEFMTETSSYENDNSIVVKVIYKGKGILLCGDIEKAGIRNLLQYDEGLLNSTVLKVPHHGSYEEDESDIFFSRVSPRIAVIPEAERNKFNLPSTNTVIRLKESGAKVYQTGINGAVMVEIKDDDYSITCYRKTD
ncbi:MAG: hypothetical protein HYV48_00245, partial [Candidatus Omnitrophica bacterium]|nr:hypothetical protein [Candidatus Omnitrophota bacterium]